MPHHHTPRNIELQEIQTVIQHAEKPQTNSRIFNASFAARTGGTPDVNYRSSVKIRIATSEPTKPQNHRFFLKYQSTPTIERTMKALAYHTPCGLLPHGRCRFIPKKPVIITSGTARVP